MKQYILFKVINWTKELDIFMHQVYSSAFRLGLKCSICSSSAIFLFLGLDTAKVKISLVLGISIAPKGEGQSSPTSTRLILRTGVIFAFAHVYLFEICSLNWLSHSTFEVIGLNRDIYTSALKRKFQLIIYLKISVIACLSIVIYVYIYPTPPPWAGCDARPILK